MLAPTTAVFCLTTKSSIAVYSRPGSKLKLPLKTIRVMRVPFSTSNRSSSGTRAITFRAKWKMDEWISVKVLSRDTVACQRALAMLGMVPHTCGKPDLLWYESAPLIEARMYNVRNVEGCQYRRLNSSRKG